MNSLFLALMVSVSAHAQSAPQAPTNGGTDLVLCSADSTRLNVYRDDLETVEFAANPYEGILPVQVTDGEQTKTKTIDGQTVTFTQVQFLTQDDDEASRGWVEDSLVVPAGACERTDLSDLDLEGLMSPVNAKSVPTAIKAVDGDCCSFPTKGRSQKSYLTGMLEFGHARAHGNRVHAACDLYRNLGDPVLAIDDGEVVLMPTPFYGTPMTCELEIRHTGGEIARYGEILCKRAPGMALHAKVKKGQVVGYVGFTGAIQPMLHFELYNGSQTGPLTVRNNRGFQRRSDLVNPTDLLLDWEKHTFGVSY